MNDVAITDKELVRRAKDIKWETTIKGSGDDAVVTVTGIWGPHEHQRFTSIYRMNLRHILKLSQKDHILYRQAEIIRRILMKMAVQEANRTGGDWESIVRKHLETEDKLRFDF